MVRRLIFLLLLLCTDRLWAEAVDPFILLELESDTTYLDGSVILNVSSTGLRDELSLSALDNLPLQRRETIGSYLRVHEGKLMEFATRRIELMPEESGDFVLGPLTAGEVESNVLTLHVLEGAPEQWSMPDNLVQLSTNITPASGYAQQMLLYEAILRYRYPLASEQFTLPDFAGFRVYPVEQEKRLWEQQGEGWRSIHWRYLLFPEQSGKLTVGPVTASGETIKSRWQRTRFERHSDPITLEIHPPAIGTGWWLPARKVDLKESWSNEPPQLLLGQSIRRRLEVTAENVSAQQIPEMVMRETRGLNLSLVNTQREESIRDGRIVAKAVFEYEILPTSATPIFMDTIRLPWWDTHTNLAETALIPARRLDVAMPDHEELVNAYRKGLSWRERLETSLNIRLPASGWWIFGGLAFISALYLGVQTTASKRRFMPTSQRELHRALQRRQLDAATRWLNRASRSGLLNNDGEWLKTQLNAALINAEEVNRSRWKQWQEIAKHVQILPEKTTPETLPPL